MLQRVSTGAGEPASIHSDNSVRDQSGADKIVRESDEWFRDLARPLLGDDAPGKILDCETGLQWGERNCRRWAAGHVKPSGWLIVTLLRSDRGAAWLHRIMDGCAAPWWLELQKHKRMGEAAERAR